ncbi:MAG TPA: tetratricopeptide repeat protein [Flavobacteriales bacterium]|nr:tetratricopeptide repeat protein [Flavobacteriales bacterium]
MNLLKSILIFSCLIGSLNLHAQNPDSLLTIYNNTSNHDTVRLKALHDAAWLLVYIDAKQAKKYALIEAGFAKKINNKIMEGRAYNTLGACNHMLGNYKKAIQFHEKSLAIRTAQNDQKGMAASISNLGAAYEGLGNFPEALEFYFRGLHIEEKIKNIEGIAQSYNDIGMIYDNMATVSDNQADFKRTISYYEKAIEFANRAKNKTVAAAAMGNLANVYDALGNYHESLKWHTRCLEIRKNSNDKHGTAISYGNIGNLVLDIDEAGLKKMGIKPGERLKVVYDYYNKCLALMQEVGDQQGIALSLQNMADVKYKEKKYTEAEKLLKEAINAFREIGDMDNEKNGHEALWRLYKTLNDPAKALYEYESYVFLQDSMYKMEIQNEIVRKDMAFEYNKKVAADSSKAAAERVKSTEKIKRQRITTWFLIGGLSLVFVFAVFMFNRFRVTQKQKQVIEEQNKKVIHQKEQLTEKNKEITDSINYAKHLQDAILPSEETWHKHLPDSFIYYRPKDIIAGDFYWMETILNSESQIPNSESRTANSEIQNSQLILFAAADCTGHGVPGAMVSIVCSNALNGAVREFGLTDPAQILSKTRELVVDTFSKASDAEYTVRDGMDIALCVYNTVTQKLSYAGANNPLWVYQKATGSILEIAANNQSVGDDNIADAFKTHTVQLSKGDVIYVFSDGYADQFGGEKGKKFKYSNLKLLLEQASQKPCQEIVSTLENTFNAWKGELEQLDDVCVVGVRV